MSILVKTEVAHNTRRKGWFANLALMACNPPFVVSVVVDVVVGVGVGVGVGVVFISQSCTNCKQSNLRPGKEMQVTASANRFKAENKTEYTIPNAL